MAGERNERLRVAMSAEGPSRLRDWPGTWELTPRRSGGGLEGGYRMQTRVEDL